ncbi:LCP family protein [Flexivirga oryzae]|uniref:LCP family protein required for cell wall assembly n=1 Tax=Flexivirga oryzae TaxID=1794944 RepID=A0A839N7F6_9MICO|nr:LCP family protein [Flexivirga oryzae]MBB2891155.1 LCP family protein required for cell wall assembly [Flexivirga oryzae]
MSSLWRRRIGVGVVALLVVIVGGGVGLYLHLNGNLRTAAFASHGHETADAAGDTPINLLVIGSDTRASSADCEIGGDCSVTGATSSKATSLAANADVLMVVHISADRTNATVLSIPRDTVMAVPACTDSATGAQETAHTARINSTFQYGADCAASAVHRLTGIAIDHFMVIDFEGVVKMSDAVGGVSVCVNRDVYDPYSHLKLAKGTHTLKGRAALEFLRTRHGFGDGSDIGRTVAQHIFLSSMLRDMESASTLANPVKVLKLANAATSAVTVDPGLGSVKALTSLAYQLSQVPGSRTTFVTAPTTPDPSNPNVVIPASNAPALFARIASDTSLTRATVGASERSTHASSAAAPTPRASTRAGTRTGVGTVAGDDDATTVSSATGCAQVSTERTVTVNGLAMTPTQAYQLAAATPDSAP